MARLLPSILAFALALAVAPPASNAQFCGGGTTPAISFDAPFDFTGPGRSMPRHTRSADPFRTWGWSCDDPDDGFPLSQRCQVWDTCSVGGSCSSNVATPSPFVALVTDGDCGTADGDPSVVSYDYDVPLADYLPDHRYFYTARCEDAAGNACLVSFPFWYDTTPPVAALDPLVVPAPPPASGTTSDPTAHLGFTCSDNSQHYDFLGGPAAVATAQCSLFRDGTLHSTQACGPAQIAVDGTETGTIQYDDLDPGAYRFEVTCTDAAIDFDAAGTVHPGNPSSPAVLEWEVESGLPPLGPYMLFRSKPTRTDGNALPKGFHLTLDDVLLPDTDADDPENFAVLKPGSIALPGDTGTSYAAYLIRGAKEGIGPAAANGRFPKPAKHSKRRIELSNTLGDVVVATKRARFLWVPTTTSPAGPPDAPADAPHFVCYDVKPTRDITAQTPDNGKGKGKFRKGVQATSGDTFSRADCALDRDGSPAFPGSAAAGLCLYDLKKPRVLCHPVATANVAPPRLTSAAIVESTPDTGVALLCYVAKRAAKIRGAEGAAATGLPVGTKIRQSKHAKRRGLQTTVGSGFPAPFEVDTKRPDLLCLPSDVLSIESR